MWYGNVIPDGMGMSYLCGMGMSYQMEWESHTIIIPYHSHTIGMESYQRWNHTIPFIQYHTNTIPYHGMAMPFIPYHTNIIPYHGMAISYHTIHTIPFIEVLSVPPLFLLDSGHSCGFLWNSSGIYQPKFHSCHEIVQFRYLHRNGPRSPVTGMAPESSDRN